ncbi:MAG: Ig-like domain-containing protein, partial [Prevotella sp.]|nr:Ig-like domain-containing protein [Prevotella sp.]
MKQKTLLHFWLLLCLFMVGATSAWADDVYEVYSENEITTGDYIIAYNGGALTAGISSNRFSVTSLSSYMSDDNVVDPNASFIWRLVIDNEGYVLIYNEALKKYAAGTGTKSQGQLTDAGATTLAQWTATAQNDGTWEFVCRGNADKNINSNLRRNGDYGFACYATTTGGSLTLYKKVEEVVDPTDTRTAIKITFDDSELTNNIALGDCLGSLRAVVTDAEDNDIFGTYDELAFWWSCEGEAGYMKELEEGEGIKGLNQTVYSDNAGHAVFTIHFDGDDNYKPATATYEFDVINKNYYAVTWSVNGETTVVPGVLVDDPIEFPDNPESVDGKVFAGWTTQAITGVTDEAPEFVTEATMGESDVTFYAVFATSTGGSAAVTDELDRAFTGVTGTSYSDWSQKTETSGAVYAGNSAGGNESIQLRSNNSNSGVVTTTSGGKLAKVTVEWNSSTDNARVLNVYGSNTAYTSASDLYGNSTQGTLLGTFKKSDGNKSLDIDDDYEYVGVRSASGAMYLAKLSITWGGGATLSGYCTTVAADTRDEAGISFAENSVTKEIVDEYTGQELTNPNNLTVTWTSSDEDVATVENGVVTMKAVGETTITASFAGNEDYKDASVSYTLTVQDSREAIELVFAEESVSVNVTETVAAPELTGNAGNGVVSYESSNPEVATVDENGVVTGVADGTVTITATVAATNEYQGGTATFTVIVVDPNKKGTQTNPYTVAEAIENTPASGNSETVYIKGVVSAFYADDIVSDGSNYRYYISDDGTTTDQLLVYKGKGLDNVAFSNADDLQVGDEIVITGQLTTYKNAAEIAANNYIVSLSRKATPTLAFEEESYMVEKETPLTITATSNSDGAITYESSNTEVAEINPTTGEVLAHAAGTTTITATVAETENYKSASVSVELTVNDLDLAKSITLNQSTGGVIEADAVKANENATVTLTATPDEGYKLTGWTILDGEANEVEYVADGNIATFTMPATEVEVEASFAVITYYDVVYSVAGQEYGESQTVEEGAKLTLPDDPTIEGVTFAGWSITDDVTAPEFVSNATVVEDDMILYAMFVAKAGSNEYRKVTSTEDITIGQYLIVYEEGKVAFNGSLTELDKSDNNVAVTIADGTIASSDAVDAAVFAIDPAEGTLLSASGFYVGQTSDANGMRTSETETYTNSFEIDTDGNADIVSSGGAHLRYNSTSGQTRFRYFKSSSYTNQKAIALYKKIASAPVYFDGTVVETLTLNEGEGYEGTNIIYANNVELNRIVKADTWSSFTVPFDIPAEQLPELVEVKKLSSSTYSSEKDYVTLTFETATSIEAGVPYMIKSTEQISNINLSNVVVDPTLNDIETTYAVMKGNMTPMNVPDGAFFISSNTWYEAAAGKPVSLKAFRAYIELTEAAQAAGVRGFEMNIDGEVTRIDAVSQS